MHALCDQNGATLQIENYLEFDHGGLIHKLYNGKN